MAQIILNGEATQIDDAQVSESLLWFIRERFGLTGAKYGCGIAMCGACTVQIDGQAVRSCVTPVSEAIGKQLTTIEGLAKGEWGAVLKSWEELDVPQCGYCQSGQIMSAHALLTKKPNPTKQDVDVAMSGNICRCGTYCSIRKAITRAADRIREGELP